MRYFLTANLFLSVSVAGVGASTQLPLGAFVCPSSIPSSKPCLPRHSPPYVQRLTNGNVQRCETSLGMGIKSFLKKSVLRRKDDDDDQDQHEAKPSIAEDVKESSDDVSDDVMESNGESIRYGHESVQDRINRLKSGDMTDEEKAAFLQTTLSAGANATSDSSKPLRQPIPSPDDPVSKRRKESASPFPKDTLLRNTFSRVPRKSSSDRPTAISKPELSSDRKKREYLEMVTNPNRFKTYVTPKTTEEPSSPIDSFISDEDSESSNLSPEKSEVSKSARSPPSTGGSDDLGSRLGAAASAEERRKREALRKQEEARQKQQQKLAEMQRMRNEEIAKREAETLERKRQVEEARKRAEEERRQAEEDQRKKMMEAQDAYWQKKLEEEREAQRTLLTAEEKEELKKKAVEEKAREREHKLHEMEREQERMRLREEERQREDPHEGEILNEAEEEKLHDREEAWKVVDRSAARIKGTDPSPEIPDVGLNSFLRQQAEEKADIDAKKEAQLEQLKALNSPLPTPSPAPAATPIMQQGRTSPSGGRSAASVSKVSSQLEAPRKPPEQSSDAKTVSDMMAELNDDEVEKDDKSSKGGGSSLGPFSRLLGKDKKEKLSPQSSSASSAPAKKGPIRQKVPVDDDGFDDFARNGPNKNMSISDAMKKSGSGSARDDQVQRSKKWGIDISKFDTD